MLYVTTNMKDIVIHDNIHIGGLTSIRKSKKLNGLLGEVLEGLWY